MSSSASGSWTSSSSWRLKCGGSGFVEAAKCFEGTGSANGTLAVQGWNGSEFFRGKVKALNRLFEIRFDVDGCVFFVFVLGWVEGRDHHRVFFARCGVFTQSHGQLSACHIELSNSPNHGSLIFAGEFGDFFFVLGGVESEPQAALSPGLRRRVGSKKKVHSGSNANNQNGNDGGHWHAITGSFGAAFNDGERCAGIVHDGGSHPS